MSLALVLTTVGNHEDAIRISRVLVEERLCACAQIQVIESVYRWEGAIVDEPEYRLLLKTTEGGREALEAWRPGWGNCTPMSCQPWCESMLIRHRTRLQIGCWRRFGYPTASRLSRLRGAKPGERYRRVWGGF